MSSKFTDLTRLTDDRYDGQTQISYKLLAGFPKISITEEGTRVTEEWCIQSSDVTKFFNIAFPGELRGTGGYGYRYLLAGDKVQKNPLACRSATLEPFTGELPGDPFDADTSAGSNTYDSYYRATLEYSTADTGEGEDPNTPPGSQTELQGHSITVGGVALTIPAEKVTIAEDDDGTFETSAEREQDDDGNIAADPQAQRDEVRNDLNPLVKIIPDLEHTLKMANKGFPNWAAMIDGLGKLNNTDTGDMMEHFRVSKDEKAQKGTVLFMGFSAGKKYVTTFDSEGTQKDRALYWDIDFRFKQRHIKESSVVRGWNHVWNSALQKWVIALRAATRADGTVDASKGKPLYEKTDFNAFLVDG